MARAGQERYPLASEILRKLVHLNSVYIVLIYEFFGKSVTLLVLTVVLIIMLEAEYFRLEWGKKIPFFEMLFRKKEKKTLGGHVFLTIGAIIAISVFSKEVALLAILMTVFGDSAAAIFGKAYGRHYIPGLKQRAIEGVTAEFVADVFVGFIYLYIFAANLSLYVVVLFVMAAFATVIETLITKLDDNLLVPIFSGIVGQSLLFVLLETGAAL